MLKNETNHTRRNILVYGMTGNIGGLENYIMYQYRQFDKTKIHVDFISAYRNVKQIAFQEEILANGSKIFHLTTKSEWINFLNENLGRYHTIIFNNTNPLELNMLRIVKEQGGFERIIIHSHNAGIDFSPIIKKITNKALAQRQNEFKEIGATLWACSTLAGKWMFGENADFEIIKNGIDTNRFKFNAEIRREVREELGLTDQDIAIGNVARFAIQKNHKFLIKFFKEFLQVKPKAKLILVGQNAPAISMQKQLTEFRSTIGGIRNKVIFLGLRKDTDRLYQAMDIFVLPSLYEGLPVVGVEAQCSGLPCFFSDTITREAALIEAVKYLPITPQEKAKELWASSIINSDFDIDNRYNAFEVVKEKGFDIREETKRVENLLLN